MTQKTNLKDSYKLYKKSVDNPLGELEYLRIVSALFKLIMQKVFEGFTVTLGAKLGVIGVRGRKAVPYLDSEGEIKGIAPDWAKTKRIWEDAAKQAGLPYQQYIDSTTKEDRPAMAYCFNEHSNGNIYNLNWYKTNALIVNKDYYSFKFSWHNKRALSQLIFNGMEYDINENI